MEGGVLEGGGAGVAVGQVRAWRVNGVASWAWARQRQQQPSIWLIWDLCLHCGLRAGRRLEVPDESYLSYIMQ